VTNRSYEQYCPIAAALDVLGTRWTLLILREVAMGDRRFTDLKDALPGVAPNLLADRLRDLQDAGLVEQVGGSSTGHPAYAITSAGREVVPVLQALARFGAGRLGPAAQAAEVRPRMAVYALLVPYHQPEGPGERFHARLRVDGETFDLVTDGPALSLRPRGDRDPDVELEFSARDLAAARQGSSLPIGSAGGKRFARLFQLA